MAVVGDDHELALEEALQRIGGDAAMESDDEDGMSVVGYEAEEEEEGDLVEPPPQGKSSQNVNVPTSTGPSITGLTGLVYTGTSNGVTASSSGNGVSLKQILNDVRSFMLFRRFLKDQCITRNLQFWLACEFFNKQTPTAEGTKVAKAIYCRFLKSSAPLHVSILDSTKRKIGTVVQFGSTPGPDLFVEAQQEVYQQMEANELRQFLFSDSFSECSQFNGLSQSMYGGSMTGEMGFQPSRYRTGASLHSSDDSTSITSFTSEDVGSSHTQVLCLPPHTRNVYTPRNAHSDTENSSSSRHRRHHSAMATHFSRNKVLTQDQFYEIICEKLSAVQRERAAMKQRARNIARIEGKSYEDIMSIDWFDTPEAIKYVRFDTIEEDTSTGGVPPHPVGDDTERSGDEPLTSPPLSSHLSHISSVVSQGPSTSQTLPPQSGLVKPLETPTSPTSSSLVSMNDSCSHLINFGFREVQEAIKELDIASQVRQKRSSLMSSSASSYVSERDSGVGGSNLPSSGSGPQGRTPNRVQAYIQNQHRVVSQQSERETQAHIAATMLINNNVPREELNPYHHHHHHGGSNRTRQQPHYSNYPGAYSSDDSSSCFTATSHSSTSDFFIPRRAQQIYGDSNDDHTGKHHPPRYPPGMRKMTPSSRRGPTSSRFIPNQAPPTTTPPPQVPLSTVSRSMSPAVHVPTAPPPPPTTDSPLGGGPILVAYTWEGKTYANKLQVVSLTLGDFKEKMFKRKGSYRFFFKSFCEELNDVILEEISDDMVQLPLFEGKIVGQVESIHDL